MSNKEDLTDFVTKKLFTWWRKIGEGGLIVIYKDGHYKLIDKQNKKNKSKFDKWDEFANDSDVKAIIWSAMSTDSIEMFSERLVKKVDESKLRSLPSKKLIDYIMDNYKKFFTKYKMRSSKDYVF